jgi:nucleoid-associated protein YgaU
MTEIEEIRQHLEQQQYGQFIESNVIVVIFAKIEEVQGYMDYNKLKRNTSQAKAYDQAGNEYLFIHMKNAVKRTMGLTFKKFIILEQCYKKI